jgi:EAL domain-containing protein (putative c-di-GMP-specific phosphodiesterase class I)
VHEALTEPFHLHDTEFNAAGSIGISVYPRDAVDATTLLRTADAAMYRAKRLEPGGHEFFSGDADAGQAKLSYANRLRRAMQEQRWVLHYQPVVDLGDGSMVGAEALIRWDEPDSGLVPPGEFIPVAEELGMIETIGDWVIDEIARQQRAWRDQGLDLEISFNLSPRQLWTPRLAAHVLEKLRDAGVDPHRITAEITESTAMADPERTQRILTELRSWGMRLALDDFGTGYSSLARLKHMPVDILKIDQAFVRNVEVDARLAGMVRAMIQVAHSLDMIPHAEGIETRAEWEFLRANGCRLAQGFWFAHPVPADELPALAARPGGLVPDA